MSLGNDQPGIGARPLKLCTPGARLPGPERSKPELSCYAIHAARLAQQQCRSTLQCGQCSKARQANTARFREAVLRGRACGGNVAANFDAAIASYPCKESSSVGMKNAKLICGLEIGATYHSPRRMVC